MRTAILMSTYQGQKYVVEQIRSILPQLQAHDLILIRDDGSSDGTTQAIDTIADHRIQLIHGTNLGFSASFLELMRTVPQNYDMFMLADQDDIWMENKVERAWQFLATRKDGPALYCARQLLVDQFGQPIALSEDFQRGPSFANALTENIVTGCTAAFNRHTLQLALKLKNTDLIYFHDWWLYLVSSAFGEVFFDKTPTIQYRQHSHNVIGRGAGLQRYLSILSFLKKKSWVHIMYNQIEAFQNSHATMLSKEQLSMIEKYFTPESRTSTLRLIFSKQRFRQSLLGDLLLRALVAFEWGLGRGLKPKRPQ